MPSLRNPAITMALLLFSSLALPPAAWGDPVVKVMNFTADWCGNCRFLQPRIEEVMDDYPRAEVERVDIDMTGLKRGRDTRRETIAALDALTQAHGAGYLWDWYGGVTGLAVVIATDTGEPITCFTSLQSREDISDRLDLALILASRARPGSRRPDGTDCPAPMR